ncbi:MAG: hypothetical protein JW395_1929 [Nitrospira sp.]|nr:hypothetical protein [Nitrospira sp.]
MLNPRVAMVTLSVGLLLWSFVSPFKTKATSPEMFGLSVFIIITVVWMLGVLIRRSRM